MYAIISGGKEIALCDNPNYVKQNEQGVWIGTNIDDATAISVSGMLYNIIGSKAIDGAPEAFAIERDGGKRAFDNSKQIIAAMAKTETIEDALCELDASELARITVIEDALCEIDAAANGGI